MNKNYHVEKLIQDENPGKPGEICILINSIYYFIGSVFIVNNNGTYQLVVNQNGRILNDNFYRTLRGAKIAFSKLFCNRGWQDNLKAEWSFFYKPDKHWLNKNCHGINTVGV